MRIIEVFGSIGGRSNLLLINKIAAQNTKKLVSLFIAKTENLTVPYISGKKGFEPLTFGFENHCSAY